MSEIDTNSPEFKQALSEAIAAEVEGLKTKNAELIAANKKLKAGATITPEELAAVESERDELKSKLNEANKAFTKATKAAEDAANRAKDIDSAYSNTLRDSALADALAKAGVTNPVHVKAAKALLRDSATVVEENGVRTVKAGDKAIGDFITEWAGSDEGKHFVAAPEHSGGGSHGGRSTSHETQGNAGGTRSEAIARAEQLLRQHASEE